MTASARLLAALVMVLLGLPLVGAAPAYAHATLVSSSPAQDLVLDAAPDQVSFTFSEPMDPVAYVVVTAPDGTALATNDPVVDDDTVTQAVEAAGEGTYLMAVKAVSEDGHPITGRVEFVVGEPSEQSADPVQDAPASDEPDASVTSSTTSAGATAGPPQWRGRDTWVWLVGPAFMAGGVALWLIGRRSPRPVEQAPRSS